MRSKPVNALATKSGKRPYVPERGDVVWFTFRPRLKGVALADQLKSLDWRAQRAEFLCKPDRVTGEILGKAGALLEPGAA